MIRETNQPILDQLLRDMKSLCVEEPAAGEQACRTMMEDLLTSSRQSFKEFLASLGHYSNSPTVEADVFDFDDQDVEKLGRHSVKQSEENRLTHIPPHTEYRSKTGTYLLERWMKR